MQRSQIRAARALLAWSTQHLSEKSGVSIAAIEQIEPGEWSLKSDPTTMNKLQEALEAAGVEFIAADANGGPGVRLHASGVGSETVSGMSDDDPES